MSVLSMPAKRGGGREGLHAAFLVSLLPLLLIPSSASAGSVIVRNGQLNASGLLVQSGWLNGTYLNVSSGGYFGGSVGIGTVSPVNSLDVVGIGNFTGQVCLAGDCRSLWPSSGASYWAASGSYLYNSTAGVNVGIGTSSPVSLLSLYQSGQNTLLNASNGTVNAGLYVGTVQGGTGASIGTNSNHRFNIFTNGTDRLTVDTSGNVGIGTVAPGWKLDINAGNVAPNSGGLRIQANSSTDLIINDTMGDNSWLIRAGHNHEKDFLIGERLGSGSLQPRLYFQNDTGNVGIGTTSPGAKLDVALAGGAFVRASDTTPRLYVTDSGNTGPTFRIDGSSTSDVAHFRGQGGIDVMYLKGNGNVGIGTTGPTKQLEIYTTAGGTVDLLRLTNFNNMAGSTAGISFKGYDQEATIRGNRTAVNLGMDTIFSNANNVDGTLTERMRITSTGNVGIGTASPSGRLHVTSDVGGSGFTTGLILDIDGMTARRVYVGAADSCGAGYRCLRVQN